MFPARVIERSGDVTGPAKRLLLLWLAAAFVCGLALRFVFPGYFDPFVPFHLDHYTYIGMHAEGYGLARYFRYYPRPVAYVLIDLCGRLGVRGLLVPLYALTLLNAALLVLYLERVTRRHVAFLSFVFFAALAYSNPEFYWNLKLDPFATFALTLLLCIFHAWQSYVETGKQAHLAGIVVLTLLFSFIKETYFIALALFLAIQSLLHVRRRRAAIALLAVSTVFMSLGLLRAAQVWTLFHASQTTGAYYTSLHPGSVWHGFLKIGKYVAIPAAAGPILAALIVAARKDRVIFCVSLASVLLGIAALLPNATLPNHLEAQYAFVSEYLFLAPLLLMDHLAPARRPWKIGLALAAIAIYGLALQEYQRPVREVAGWLRQQEQIARRMLPALERMKAGTNVGENSLVTGATMFYNPFLAPEFILSEFGPQRFWTVVVPDGIAENKRHTTQLVHASSLASSPARVAGYDHVFVFAPDGQLVVCR